MGLPCSRPSLMALEVCHFKIKPHYTYSNVVTHMLIKRNIALLYNNAIRLQRCHPQHHYFIIYNVAF